MLLLFVFAWIYLRPATVSEAVAGVGTVFKRGDGESSEQFTAIAEINSITGPNQTRGTIDVTSLDSTAGYREFIASFRDGGTVALAMNWTRDGWEAMLDDFEADSSVNYQIVLPDTGATTLDFAGLVTDVGMAIPFDDKITSDVTIKITGQVGITS